MTDADPARVAPPATPRRRPPEASPAAQPLNTWRGWPPLLLLPASVLLFTPDTWPRWAFMWALAFAIYAGCKWLTWARTPVRQTSPSLHLGYLLAWPGMDAAAFLKPRTPDSLQKPTRSEWLAAGGKLALGIGLLLGLAPRVPAHYPYVVGWTGMVGLVMSLHFGIFHLLSCFWRSLGVEAHPLMNAPLASTSLSEFWGRRWNMAFRDLTYCFLFRPLTPRIGPRRALLTGFLLSGLVHDLVISVPAGGGFGGPTLFFLLQAAGIATERSAAGRRIGLGTGLRGWLFTMLVLLLPVYALLHRPFVVGVIVPFLHALRAI